jgi:ribosomal protein L24
MERRRFKLGDKVEIRVGHEKGRLGHVVSIGANDGGQDVIEVRLLPERLRIAKLAPADLSHAQG